MRVAFKDDEGRIMLLNSGELSFIPEDDTFIIEAYQYYGKWVSKSILLRNGRGTNIIKEACQNGYADLTDYVFKYEEPLKTIKENHFHIPR